MTYLILEKRQAHLVEHTREGYTNNIAAQKSSRKCLEYIIHLVFPTMKDIFYT
jgi:hypothetical protein